MSQKWHSRDLQESVPPLKLSLSWQKLTESTFSELWNLIKNLQWSPTSGVLNEKSSCKISVTKHCSIFAYPSNIPHSAAWRWPLGQQPIFLVWLAGARGR